MDLATFLLGLWALCMLAILGFVLAKTWRVWLAVLDGFLWVPEVNVPNDLRELEELDDR